MRKTAIVFLSLCLLALPHRTVLGQAIVPTITSPQSRTTVQQQAGPVRGPGFLPTQSPLTGSKDTSHASDPFYGGGTKPKEGSPEAGSGSKADAQKATQGACTSGACGFGSGTPQYATPSSSHGTGPSKSEPAKKTTLLNAKDLEMDYQQVVDAIHNASDIVTVLPETTTPIRLSNVDVNRITCLAGPVKDVIYSQEKGVLVQFAGNDAYLKFLSKQSGKNIQRVSIPTDVFIVCGNQTYSIIAVPSKIPAQTVRLVPGVGEKAKKNVELYGSMPFERKVVEIIKGLYQRDLPDSVTLTTSNRAIDAFSNLTMHHVFTATVEGEGIAVKEYVVTNTSKDKVELKEKMFLVPDIAKAPLAIAIDIPVLKPNASARIFIVESTHERGEL